MASLSERSDKKRYEKAKKQQQKFRIAAVVFGILLLVTAIVILVNSQINRNYKKYKVLHSIERADSNTVQYKSYNGKILKYSRDGASAMNSKGEIIWNGSYDFKNPVAVTCENYVAIADIGGKEIYVYNGNDSGTRVEVLLPIVQVALANQGVIAVVLEDDTSTLVHLYDPYNTSEPLRVKIPTNTDTDGFPIDIALSKDGQKLVTSYINISSGVIESSLNFYNFDKVGQNNVDRIVGSRPYDKIIVPKIEFLNNNVICAYTENGFSIYSMKQIPQDIFSQTFEEKIKSVCSYGNYIGIILENSVGETGKNQIIIYNLKGKKVLEKEIEYEYDTVTMAEDEVIFSTNTTCNILRFNGTEKFHYSFEQNIEYFMPIMNTEKYFMINDTEIQEIRLAQ